MEYILIEGYFFLDKEGRITKWIDINGKRGGEEGIENLNLQSNQVALKLLSSCSQVALFKGWEQNGGHRSRLIGLPRHLPRIILNRYDIDS